MLDDSIHEWIIKYTFPDLVCVGRKPHPFGNERHTIACGLSTIMLFTEILEGRYFPRERGRPKFDDIGKTV